MVSTVTYMQSTVNGASARTEDTHAHRSIKPVGRSVIKVAQSQ